MSSSPTVPKRGEYIIIQLDPVASLERLDDPIAIEAGRALKPSKYLACVVMRLPAFVGIPVQLFVCLASVRGMVPGPDEFLIPEMCLPLSPNTHPWDRQQLTSEPTLPWPGLDCFLMTLASLNVLTEYRVEDTRLRGKYTQPGVADLSVSITFDKDWKKRLELGVLDLASGDPTPAMHRPIDDDDDSYEYPAHWNLKKSADNDDVQAGSPAEKSDPIQEPDVDINAGECRTDADSESSSSSSSSVITKTHSDSDATPSVRTASVDDRALQDPRRTMPFVRCCVDLESIALEEIGNPWDFLKEIEVLKRLEEESRIRVQERIKAVADMDAELDVVVKRTRSLLSLTKKSDSASDRSNDSINVVQPRKSIEEVSVDVDAPRDVRELAAPLASKTREETVAPVEMSEPEVNQADLSSTKRGPHGKLHSFAKRIVSRIRIGRKLPRADQMMADSQPYSKRCCKVPSLVVSQLTRVWRRVVVS